MSNDNRNEQHEIVFGLIAPIGTKLDLLINKLENTLSRFDFMCEQITLTKYLKIDDSNKRYNQIKNKIEKGTKLRETSKSNDIFSLLAVYSIHKIHKSKDTKNKKIAYIIRQLKRPEEVLALRYVYGNALYLISAYSSKQNRLDYISKFLGNGIGKDYSKEAKDLMDTDEKEEGEYGQCLRDTFPLGDFFIDMDRSEEEVESAIIRIVNLIFGVNITPTREEYGMFHAFATALTSSSLARQVGAAIATKNGDIVADGTNEVPKPFGGLYWYEDSNKKRDYELGYDLNTKSKKKIVEDIKNKVIEELDKYSKNENIEESINEPNISKQDKEPVNIQELLKIIRGLNISESELLKSLELSRTVHAEMSALMTAARLGVSVKDCILYTTTFPCHYCAKHIVAAGIKEVVYIEPYPKSLVNELYPDSISVDDDNNNKVIFRQYIGVSPRRYIDLFDMKNPLAPLYRKDEKGDAIKPTKGNLPRFEVNLLTVCKKEEVLLYRLYRLFEEKNYNKDEEELLQDEEELKKEFANNKKDLESDKNTLEYEYKKLEGSYKKIL